MNKKILLASLLSIVTLVGCGPDIPTPGPESTPEPSEPAKESVDLLKDDLSKNVSLKLSVNYNKDTGIYSCIRCQYRGTEADVLEKNEMVRFRYLARAERYTKFDFD